MKKCFFLFLFYSFSVQAQTDSTRLQWFNDAKLGIFIHWGMYAVNGTSESWSFHNGTVPYAVYMNQMKGFSAAKFNPKQWAELIVESGAKYAVVTTQHHDGLALWDTKQLTPYPSKTDWNTFFPNQVYPTKKNALWNPEKPLSTIYQTPAAKDLITPLSKAFREAGLKFGTYYSLLDWSHPDYPKFLKETDRYKIADDPARWKRFLNFMHHQISEINTQFSPDLYWFDGDWEHSEAEWNAAKIDSIIHTSNPKAILNGRLHSYGDYSTPEQNMPIVHPEKKSWELCLTSNESWGYQPSDTNYKTTNEVLQIFTECLNMGGNLLLDIGPKADGTIPEEQIKLLKEVGRWTQKHAEAIYGTTAGLPSGHYHGNSTLSQDRKTLYLFVNQIRSNGNSQNTTIDLMLKGLKNQITAAEVLGSNAKVPLKIVGKISWSWVPGTVFLKVPAESLDSEITVIKLTLNSPLDLYEGRGGFH
ncbi:alpha-L-fucosidase [Fluviicola sp.]|uniref:alpha-L-fucosidase n=1 Tax=Fluviicola sp. TaxID=1917219 RepID=UPI00262C0FE9|nr:alpha-L-fucosidase [Fluviicola sp.]